MTRINGKSADIALLADTHHLGPVSNSRGSGQDSAAGTQPTREWRGRNENLAAAYQRMNEHVAMVTHELRNSLGAIRYAARVMQMKQREPDVVEKARMIIEGQVGQMARFIDDLIEASLLRSGRLCVQRERVDLCVVARLAIESVELEIGERKQRLTVALPKAPVWLQADPGRLTQVLVNLLHNAAKATDAGGELRLSVEHEAGLATVRVLDSGSDRVQGVLPHGLEPFMPVQSSLPRSEQEIGIGLALVHSLVELHGGRVTAASVGPGRGSEFTVHLPVTF